MLFGNCKTLKSILSIRLFEILAKSSYALYLIHPLVIFYCYLTEPNVKETSLSSVGYNFAFVTLVSHVFSFIVTIVIESPMFALEGYYQERKPKTSMNQ